MLGLRGEDVTLTPGGQPSAPMRVRVVEPMGSHLLLTGTVEGQPLRVVAAPTAGVTAGTEIGLIIDPNRVTWINDSTGRAIH